MRPKHSKDKEMPCLHDNDLFKNKYRISSSRLQNWDYGWNGTYFKTICTHNRQYFLGDITDGKMSLSKIGELTNKYWFEIQNHFPFIELGTFVVMPNHVHGIIDIDKSVDTITVTANKPDNDNNKKNDNTKTIGQKRFQNQGKHTLSSIIGSYKSNKNVRKFYPGFAWQSHFHDHIIRNENSYQGISDYIKNNPVRWFEDTINIEIKEVFK